MHGTPGARISSRGPRHYERSSLPGLDKVVAIAGHRTTFGAPFRHIDRLGTGDVITVQVAYGTFHYRVFAHEIVGSDDWSILRERGFETLVLSACLPLYSSSHRWIVYARLATSSGRPSDRTPFLPVGNTASRRSPARRRAPCSTSARRSRR